MSSPAIIAKVRIQPPAGPEEEWLIPMWHAGGPRYRSWVPLPVGAAYEVFEATDPTEPISEISLDYTDAALLKKKST